MNKAPRVALKSVGKSPRSGGRGVGAMAGDAGAAYPFAGGEDYIECVAVRDCVEAADLVEMRPHLIRAG